MLLRKVTTSKFANTALRLCTPWESSMVAPSRRRASWPIVVRVKDALTIPAASAPRPWYISFKVPASLGSSSRESISG